MKSPNGRIAGKYFWMELFFMLFACYFITIISDIEYSYHEEKDVWRFIADLEYRLIYGSFDFILYSAFYWLFFKPLLFKKQFLYFTLSIIGFLVVHEFMAKYQHLVVTNMSFVSADIRTRALKDFQVKQLNFVMAYVIVRDLFPLLGFAFVIRSLQQDEQVKALKEQQLITELNYLKAQLQPHFFFNTLNNIYALATRSSKDTAPMVAKLSEMMRYIIYESGHAQVPLNKEIQFLKNYIEIEKIRRPATIVIDFDVQGSTDQHQIEPLLLLPLIENAFKHGIEDEMESGFVRVVLDVSEKELTLQVENSKPAAPPTKSEGGLGLTNMEQRLNLLYPGKHQLETENSGTSYRAILTLQLT